MSNISNIDDLLAGVGNSQQPTTPEHKEKAPDETDYSGELESNDDDDLDVKNEGDLIDSEEEDAKEDEGDDEPSRNDRASEGDDELDDYGNKKERMPKGMKDRLDRKEKQYQEEVAQRDYEISRLRQQLSQTGASPEVQQAAKDFQYDPNDSDGWEQQLAAFVDSRLDNRQKEHHAKQMEAKEQHEEQKFRQKFTQGMDRFSDFREVVSKQPIDDAMTLSLRGMNDPSAFIYAVSKRQPGELERISKIPDYYARITEMGKLEERMRRNKPSTSTPRPLGRPKEDGTPRVTPKQQERTGDDLLARADAKRLNTVKQRHRGNR